MTDFESTLDEFEKTKHHSVKFILDKAGAHPGTCRCGLCLRFWILVGPDGSGGRWNFGPFTQEEFEQAGGVVPAYLPGEEPDEPEFLPCQSVDDISEPKGDVTLLF